MSMSGPASSDPWSGERRAGPSECPPGSPAPLRVLEAVNELARVAAPGRDGTRAVAPGPRKMRVEDRERLGSPGAGGGRPHAAPGEDGGEGGSAEAEPRARSTCGL